MSVFFVGSVMAAEIHINQLAEMDSFADKLYLKSAGGLAAILKTRRCVSYDRGDYVVVTPECLLDNQLPQLDFQEAVDMVLPYIASVENFYDVDTDEFYYEQAQLHIEDDLLAASSVLYNPNTLLLRLLSHRDYLIRIPKLYLAVQQIEGYSFYAATRDVSGYGTCRKTNYDLALEQLDTLFLKPGELFNMNRAISRLPGYCAGDGGEFLFYQ
ncbi:MAG: hypothetical protein H6765_02150 [Candidatus Peribacteria bacterium]|nr:MAG: hypothetical protein H6765_02150 [Candidatus Peribacteria bacterium]